MSEVEYVRQFPILENICFDNFRYWQNPILTISSSDKIQSCSFPALTISNSYKNPVLTFSNSDNFKFWQFPFSPPQSWQCAGIFQFLRGIKFLAPNYPPTRWIKLLWFLEWQTFLRISNDRYIGVGSFFVILLNYKLAVYFVSWNYINDCACYISGSFEIDSSCILIYFSALR